MLPYNSSSKLLSLREVIGEDPAYGEDRGARGRADAVPGAVVDEGDHLLLCCPDLAIRVFRFTFTF